MNNENTELFENFLSAGIIDNKGREVGYIVALIVCEGVAWARVQKAVNVKGDFKDFGPAQSGKKFNTQDEARNWAYKTAKERIAKLVAQ